MSSVKPDRNAEDAARAAALLEEHEQFCTELADGLHALAQPLTILRSAIAMLALSKEDGTAGERYLSMSMRQIERTCQLFSSVQGLLAAKMVPAERETIDIGSVLRQVINDHSQAVEARGIDLIAASFKSSGMVFGDRRRTELAIAAAFETAVSVSSAGDVIKVDASPSDGLLEISFESTGGLDNIVTSLDRLNVSLARTNILSQQGQYQFTQEPFRISLALPACQHALEKSGTTCCPVFTS